MCDDLHMQEYERVTVMLHARYKQVRVFAWCAHAQPRTATHSSSSSVLTCAVLPFAFALSALWVIRSPSLRRAEQQRQQAGGHQVPDNPAGTPGTPPRA